MSYLFSRALVEEYLGENCSDGEPSVQSSGNPMPLAYCAPDKMTVFSRLSRFGVTFKPLTESRGEELLTLYREAFPAKTSVQQEKVQALTENEAECGEKWPEWLAKFDPNTCSWRIAQCSLFEEESELLQTLPRSGMTANGLLWERPMLAQTIRETESGFWLTPTATNISHRSEESMKKRFEYRKKLGRNGVGAGCLAEQVTWSRTGRPVSYITRNQMLPTPTAHNAKETNAPSEALRHAPSLAFHAGGKLNPDWVEWLMNWPIKWSNINEFNAKEYYRWQEASATAIQKPLQMRTMWWDRDPSQTSHRPRYQQQQEQQHSDSLHQMPRITSCKSEVERSHEGQDLSVLRDSVHIQETERKDLQSGVREQTCMDEAQIVPRISHSIIGQVDRLKAIGNGQVPLCAATAWRILSEQQT